MIKRDPGSDQVTTAVLLAAGAGTRLQPLTFDAPKCLTEINGTSLLEHQVLSLLEWGFDRLVVVVGHMESCIRKFLDKRFNAMQIEYVVNPRYRTTGNLYSLWLAREKIKESFLLMECDLIFDASLLGDMLLPNKIAVSRIQPWMNGTTVSLDPMQQVAAIRVGACARAEGYAYKTVNIYSLSLPLWNQVVERLGRYVSAGLVNEYYEVVFADMIADNDLSFQAAFFDIQRWYEIDNSNDLHEAQRIFAAHPHMLSSLMPNRDIHPFIRKKQASSLIKAADN